MQLLLSWGYIISHSMEGLTDFESDWGRDIGLTIVGWLLVSAIAIVLMLTVFQSVLG